ncbi:hypothetical protein LEP1GSC050_4118 [Leptospira broomii serovar Hurstbridge str. 5399]|uniref:Uncharacterized protein n=1 Tax=Leptospira broomii serovar Hurstbridge str. 5399 TaxID=1049789 RepID=T0GJ82_9LEPT|nr:hypothetical protein [Leptospira broomii]EQA45438.1 hypothetical protein LEP1GSC050_4118 [Leptospira broomii serovar Hurstbridge str. 5399]
MSEKIKEPKVKKKSKVEMKIDELSLQLKSKEISPMEFAEKFPIKVEKMPKEELIPIAVTVYKETHGEKKYKKIQNDFDAIIGIVREFVLMYMTTLREGYQFIKKNDKAFALLTQRAADESMRVYPWLSENYYMD